MMLGILFVCLVDTRLKARQTVINNEVIAFFLGHPCCKIAGELLCLAQMLQSEQINVKEAAVSVIGVLGGLHSEPGYKAFVAAGSQ